MQNYQWEAITQFIFPEGIGSVEEVISVDIKPRWQQVETEESIRLVGVYHIQSVVRFNRKQFPNYSEGILIEHLEFDGNHGYFEYAYPLEVDLPKDQVLPNSKPNLMVKDVQYFVFDGSCCTFRWDVHCSIPELEDDESSKYEQLLHDTLDGTNSRMEQSLIDQSEMEYSLDISKILPQSEEDFAHHQTNAHESSSDEQKELAEQCKNQQLPQDSVSKTIEQQMLGEESSSSSKALEQQMMQEDSTSSSEMMEQQILREEASSSSETMKQQMMKEDSSSASEAMKQQLTENKANTQQTNEQKSSSDEQELSTENSIIQEIAQDSSSKVIEQQLIEPDSSSKTEKFQEKLVHHYEQTNVLETSNDGTLQSSEVITEKNHQESESQYYEQRSVLYEEDLMNKELQKYEKYLQQEKSDDFLESLTEEYTILRLNKINHK